MEQQKRSTSWRKKEQKNNKDSKASSPPKKEQIEEQTSKQAILMGICAMRKKVESKPMRQILNRMKCPEIEFVQMWEYLDKPYKSWPIVDALICFYSEGFPYLKAWKYVKKHKPFLINNLQKQQYLWDRTVVYDILKKIRIPVAKHYMNFKDLNYIDEIEQKAFYTEQQLQSFRLSGCESQQSKNEIERLELRTSNSGSNSHSSQNHSHSHIHNNIANTKSENLSEKANSQCQSTGNIQKQRQIEKQRMPSMLRKQTYDFSLDHLMEKQKDKQDRSQEPKQPLTAKRSLNRDLPTQTRPCTLRKFHQERISKIQEYDLQEKDDQLFIKTKQKVHKLKKPFVQKPFDAQNHQICIYYPQAMGGGRKMLFRKVKNSSSTYEPNCNRIRRDGNYIYEEYLPNNAFDIKVYTIGEFYMYAEARKSPTLDGVVERDALGKEKRFPIILTPEEKFIAKKIVQQFGQQVCGFDLLRANGRSYVCDVNGWSFVKGNSKYWTDCAKILKKKIFNRFFPHLIKQQTKSYERFNMSSQNSYRPPLNYLIPSYKQQQLRSIVSVFRHGDRSPKLKLKFKTSQPKFIAFFGDGSENELKIKDANGLTKLLQRTLQVIGDNPNMKAGDLAKLGQMKSVLESGGHFQGLTRKCQLKVIQRNTQTNNIEKIMIVFKWGGELSAQGFIDSVELGKKMRMQKYNDDQDFLSLHSSYRHDLKTYSSDEGRCIKTAAAFLKGFLNIEGGLAPIITSMVMTNKKAQNLLDCTSVQNHSSLVEHIVKRLSDMLNSGEDLPEAYKKQVPEQEVVPQMMRIMKQIGNSRQKLKTLHKWIVELTLLLQNQKLAEYYAQGQSTSRASGIGEEETKEDIVLIYQRWSKLQKDFYIEDQMRFNISKIPEIYDTIRHDLSKNKEVFSRLDFDSTAFMELAKNFAYFVVSNEYGITNAQKIVTAQQIISPLLDKILTDLLFWKDKEYEEQYWKYQNNGNAEDWKHIRTRLYFTSASHIYSLLHLLTLGNDSELLKSTPQQQTQKINKFIYMSYLSHIEFRLYQNLVMNSNDPNRFRVELSIYPDYSKDKPIQQAILGKGGFTIDQIQSFITSVTKTQKQKSKENKENKEIKEEEGEKEKKNFLRKINKEKSHSNQKLRKETEEKDSS